MDKSLASFSVFKSDEEAKVQESLEDTKHRCDNDTGISKRVQHLLAKRASSLSFSLFLSASAFPNFFFLSFLPPSIFPRVCAPRKKRRRSPPFEL